MSIKCPKCRYSHRPWDGIASGDELDCEACGFRFAVDVHVVREFETHCVEHKFGDTQTDRYGESYAVCKRCDLVRTVESTPAIPDEGVNGECRTTCTASRFASAT